jgi:hypothetical protein
MDTVWLCDYYGIEFRSVLLNKIAEVEWKNHKYYMRTLLIQLISVVGADKAFYGDEVTHLLND